MSTEVTPAAPLINLGIYLVVVFALAGAVIVLGRWPRRSPGPALAEPPADPAPDEPPRVPPVAPAPVYPSSSAPAGAPRPARPVDPWPVGRLLARRWRRFSLVAFLSAHERNALWVLFGLALALRLAFLETIPGNVTADELDFAGNALSIISGHGPSFFGLDWTPQPALSVHLISWSWRLFGMTIFAERLVSALLAAIGVFPFYALARRAVAAPAALAATLLFASSWWFLHFSRSGWNNGHVVLYMLLAAWALCRALERRRWRDWIGFGAALALLLYGYFSGRAVALALLGYLALALWWRRRDDAPGGRWRQPLGALLAGGVCLLLLVPMAPAVLGDLPRFNQRTSAVFVLNAPREPGQSAAELLARQTWTTFRSFVLMDTQGGAGRYKPPGQSWLDPLSAALYLVGLPLAVRRWRAAALWWCLLLVPLGLTQVLTNRIPDGARALVVVAPIYLFAALTLDSLIARQWMRGAGAQAALAGLLAFAAVLNVRIYLDWMAQPRALAEREPAVAAADFYLWREYQLARLAAGEGILDAGAYNALSPAAVAARVAGDLATPDVPATPPAAPPVAPVEVAARLVATLGTPGDGAGQLAAPRSVAADREGGIFVADPQRGKILYFGPDGAFLREWGDPEHLGNPAAVIVAPDGTVVALDAEGQRIARFDRQGRFIAQVAVFDGRARGLALGLDGRIYVAYTSNNRLLVLPATGAAPSPLAGPPGLHVAYDQPTAAIAAADGSLVVYEPVKERLRGFAPGGQARFTQRAPSIDTIAAGGLALLPGGRILLADPGARRVMIFGADGAGVGWFAVEGRPQGLAVTAAGQVAVTDAAGRRILLYEPGAR